MCVLPLPKARSVFGPCFHGFWSNPLSLAEAKIVSLSPLTQPAFGKPHEGPDLAFRGSGAAHAEVCVLVLHACHKDAMILASDQWRGGGSAPEPTAAPYRPPPCRLCFAPRSALPPPFVLQVNAVICDTSRDRRKSTRDVANYRIKSQELR